MTTLMEEFMEQQEQMALKQEASQEDRNPNQNMVQTNSNNDEQYSHLEKSVASTGYCTIEMKNPERSTVNIKGLFIKNLLFQNLECNLLVNRWSQEAVLLRTWCTN